jgi:D-alanine-D-alanine ligase
MMKVDVLMGGPGREAVISRRSGTAIAEALRRRGHDVVVVDITERLDATTLRPDAVVFNIIHGTYGEDGALQAELDALGISYVGSDAAVSRLCMDKSQTKARLTEKGLRVPWGVRLDLRQPFSPKDLRIPHHAGLVLKPASDGSSVGLKMVANPSFVLPAIEEILRELGAVPYLLEERLPGPEYTVAVVDLGDGPRALPPLTIRAAAGVFDFEAKYQRADTQEMPVADAAIAARLAELGLAAHRACGCRDISRCDIMRTSDGDYALLEVNTLPGFTNASLVPKAAAAAGITFEDLVERLAERAASRAADTNSAHHSAAEGTTP